MACSPPLPRRAEGSGPVLTKWRTAGAERISGRSECAAEREWSEREGRRGMIGLAPSGGTAVTEKRRGTRNRRPP